ncbi:MAG: alpha/beta fold hydrolase [Candidatus Sulfotelmatobacter sp.]
MSSRKKLSPTTVDVLARIWRRVLQRENIGLEDRFYNVGGTDALADRLFAEITAAFNRQLPTATICHAPTIAALAVVLEQQTLPRFSPFVKLKDGSKKTPVLIAHGLGGRASFSELAKHILTDHSIYGIQAKGVDGLEQPFDHIEDMAEFYLEALRELRTQSSCLLIGYSFGGLVALEMAQRLSEQGKTVPLLALVDTYPHPRYLALGQRSWLVAKRIRGRISDLRNKPLRAEFYRAADNVKKWLHIGGTVKSSVASGGPASLSFAQTTVRVKQSDLLAMKSYRPRFYPGKMKFVRPESNSYLPTDPTAAWKKMAAEFQIDTVPGDHLGMISTHFESLAQILTQYIREANVE